MKNASEAYGAVRFGDTLYTARVENDGTRWKVTSLAASADDIDGEALDSGRLFFGVATHLAVVKKITVPRSSSPYAAEAAEFEMAQSLLEEPDQFYYETLALDDAGGCRRFLVVAYHRPEIDRLIQTYQETLRKPSGFKLDAVALAAGYHAFCRREPGELQVLADLETDRAVVAILHRGKTYAVDYLHMAPGEKLSPAAIRKMAAEFKMMLSFHLAGLFQDGVSVPLSRIVLSGTYARDPLVVTALKEHFTAEIALPHFHEGYFQPAATTIERHPPERFLIPLGLAVE